MPIAIRHRSSFHYLNAVCDWVEQIDDACNFVDSQVAERVCAERGFDETDILLIFEDGSAVMFRYERSLP